MSWNNQKTKQKKDIINEERIGGSIDWKSVQDQHVTVIVGRAARKLRQFFTILLRTEICSWFFSRVGDGGYYTTCYEHVKSMKLN